MSPVQTLTPGDVAERVADELVVALGSELKRVLLYGSRARGDSSEESDLDLLVVVADGADARAARDRALEITADIYRWPLLVSAVVMAEDTLVRSEEPFLAAIRREGVSLRSAPDARDYRSWTGPMMPRQDRLPEARRRLEAAHRALEAGDLPEAIQSAYYAARSAAEELILRSGRQAPKPQSGLSAVFGALVRDEAPDVGRVLGELSDRRIAVVYPAPPDYATVEPTVAEARARVDAAAGLIETVESLAKRQPERFPPPGGRGGR